MCHNILLIAMEEGYSIFSIRDLENLSGIKAHTIRIWEKRYSILKPDRTDTNIRTYSESELKKILNVSYLNRNGYKISKIAGLSDDELTHQVMQVSSSKDDPDQNFQTGRILMSAIKFNEENFKEALIPYLKEPGIEEAYTRYFHPLLEKTKILWQTGSLSRAQEQFICNTIKQMIIIEDNKLPSLSGKSVSTVAMINISENLTTENNFFFYKYILKKRGFDVIFTGGSLPATEVTEIYKIKPFDYLIVISGTFNLGGKKISYFSNLVNSLKINKIIIADSPGEYTEDYSDKVEYVRNPDDFINRIDKLLKA